MYNAWACFRNGSLYLSAFLGNDNIHQITSHGSYTLKFRLTDWDDETRYAIYNNFSIASEADAYRLSIVQFVGGGAGNLLLLSTYLIALAYKCRNM